MKSTVTVNWRRLAEPTSRSLTQRHGTMRTLPAKNHVSESQWKQPYRSCVMPSHGHRCMKDWHKLICAMSRKVAVRCFGWQTSRSKPLASGVNSAGHGWRDGWVHSSRICTAIQSSSHSDRRNHFAQICRQAGQSIAKRSKKPVEKRRVLRFSNARITAPPAFYKIPSSKRNGPRSTKRANGPVVP